MNKGIIAVAIAAAPLAALADSPSYDYAQGSLVGQASSVGSADVDYFGFGVEGSYEFTPGFFGQASYTNMSDEVGNTDVDQSMWTIGAGYIFYDEMDTNAYVKADLRNGNVEAGSLDDDFDGYSVAFGVRSQLSQQLELNGELGYADMEDDGQFELTAGFVYSLMNDWGLSVDVTTSDGDMGYSFGARYEF